MKRSISGAAVLVIALGTAALVGCESTPSGGTSGVNPAMSGGNGEFGESPAYPGAYNDAHHAAPPTTRPATYN